MTDELIEAINLYLEDQGYEYDMDHPDARRRISADIAAVALAAGYSKPRTITTAQELDALPGESVIRDLSGMVYELDYIVGEPSKKWWIETGNDRPISESRIDLPATVLYEPQP